MASQAIVAILAVLALSALAPAVHSLAISKQAQTTAPAPAQNATAPAPAQNATADNIATISLAINITLSIPDLRPEVAEAFATLQAHAADIKEYALAALKNISADATSDVDKLVSFLTNLKNEIQNAGDELSNEVKEELTTAIDTIQSYIAESRAALQNLITEAKAKLAAAAEKLKEDVKTLTNFLVQQLQKLRQVINNKLNLIFAPFRQALNSAIDALTTAVNSNNVEVESALADIAKNAQGNAIKVRDVIAAAATKLDSATAKLVAFLLQQVSKLNNGSLEATVTIGA